MPVPEPSSSTGDGALSGSTTTNNNNNNNSNNNKGPGLIRRISSAGKSNASKLTRRRQSTSHHDGRDNSCGPVTFRRGRSDSKTGTSPRGDGTLDSSHEEEEETYDSFTTLCGLEGALLKTEGRMSIASVASDIAPKVDPVLQRGSPLTKVTKQKKRLRTFFVDFDSAKVFWDSPNAGKQLYIDYIREIRVGADARNYREEHQVSEEFENRWFTIIYADPDRSKGRTLKTMHLIASDEATFKLWTTTLDHISRYRIGLMAGLAGNTQNETTLLAHWKREMDRRHPQGLKFGEEECLDFPAVENLCLSLHINCSKDILRTHFNEADTLKRKKLNFVQFQDFLHRLKDRQDVREIYWSIAKDPADGLTLTEFFDFLQQTQCEDVEQNQNYWTMTFDKYVRRSRARTPSHPESADGYVARMSFDAFLSFLSSSSNSVYPSQIQTPKLDRPLSEYFISSSHNTYLLGRQFAGASSTEAYITALQNGCRCIEIDCWDGADGRPIVVHGRTMTSSVLFADCIDVINRYAFLSSEFPLILSLEVHCCAEQQLSMVNIMKEAFREQLLLEPLMRNCPILPSPDELKRRILVKVKTSDDAGESSTTSVNTVGGRKRSVSSPFAHPTVPENSTYSGPGSLSTPPTIEPGETGRLAWTPGERSLTATSMSSASEDSESHAQMLAGKDRSKRQKSKVTKALSDLAVYTRSYKWHGFNSPESKLYNHLYSFSEKSFQSICRNPENKTLLENHNKKYLTRVYPAYIRFRSDNFDPNIFWRRGVQMAALNWQTYDIGMQMNQAMFAAGSDRTGYVLKPESLRPPVSSTLANWDVKTKLDRKLVKFEVNVISAQHLPRCRNMGPDDSINPYIAIEMFSADDKVKGSVYGEGGMDTSSRSGMSGIGLPHRRRTEIAKQNGFNPIFDSPFKLSLETKYPDLVFVRWVVWNSLDGRSTGGNNSIQLATFTAKLSSLSQGYRYLPLYDDEGYRYLFSTLFCKVTKYEPTPARHRLDLAEVKAERMNIFRQLGQSVFKRTLSIERDRDKDTNKDREKMRGKQTDFKN